MRDDIGRIRIEKKETTVDLVGLAPKEVKYLQIYANNKCANLDFLSEYPNIEALFVKGDIGNVDGISALSRLNELTILFPSYVDLSAVKVPTLKNLSVYNQINPGFSSLLTDKIEYLELMEMRGLSDLSFIEEVASLKKLYLNSLPSVEVLPDFSKLPNLYALKIYELHKLNDIESLTNSYIRFLAFTLAADKLSGTKIAEVLLQMKSIEKADMSFLDRSNPHRNTVLENRLKKSGREELLNIFIDFDRWKRL